MFPALLKFNLNLKETRVNMKSCKEVTCFKVRSLCPGGEDEEEEEEDEDEDSDDDVQITIDKDKIEAAKTSYQANLRSSKARINVPFGSSQLNFG